MFGDMPQCYWTAHDAMSGTPAEMTIPMSQLHIYCAPTGPNYMQTFSKRFGCGMSALRPLRASGHLTKQRVDRESFPVHQHRKLDGIRT